MQGIDLHLTEQKVDAILLKAAPFGDKDVRLPEKASEYAKICTELIWFLNKTLTIY